MIEDAASVGKWSFSQRRLRCESKANILVFHWPPAVMQTVAFCARLADPGRQCPLSAKDDVGRDASRQKPVLRGEFLLSIYFDVFGKPADQGPESIRTPKHKLAAACSGALYWSDMQISQRCIAAIALKRALAS